MAERRPKRVKIKTGSFSWQKTSICSLFGRAMVSGARFPVSSLAGSSRHQYLHWIALYITMVKGKLIVLDEELFLAVGGSSSSGEPLACMLVQQITNHAQPTTNDLKMIFAIKQEILANWPVEILIVKSGIGTSSSRLLSYGIFISRIIDQMEIDTSDVEIKLTNTHDHQLGEYLIHKIGIYKIIVTPQISFSE
ncbi:hypothetical protein Lal_00032160 [Lupinus albus]|nr:hypothetical protein Lal_00032160 [Lupinus albus]